MSSLESAQRRCDEVHIDVLLSALGGGGDGEVSAEEEQVVIIVIAQLLARQRGHEERASCHVQEKPACAERPLSRMQNIDGFCRRSTASRRNRRFCIRFA